MKYALIALITVCALTGFSCARKTPPPASRQPAAAVPGSVESSSDVPISTGMTERDVQYQQEVKTAPKPAALPF